MTWHRVTIPKAVLLTERPRHSLYPNQANGHLAYLVGHDSQRFVNISELIRTCGSSPDPEEKEIPESLLAQIADQTHRLPPQVVRMDY